LGFCHSTDLFSYIMYKIYVLIPFIEELRVLTDWTTTKTSLNFFMWMKLEDAHQNLYITFADMEYRQSFAPAVPRPPCEKFWQGCCLLLLLFIVITLPIMFFSSLTNGLRSANSVTSGMLTVSLNVSSDNSWTSSNLFQTTESNFRAVKPPSYQMYNKRLDLTDCTWQHVHFANTSDSLWIVTPVVRQEITTKLDQCKVQNCSVLLLFTFSFKRVQGSTAVLPVRVQLDTDGQVQQMYDVLNGDNSTNPTQNISVQQNFTPWLHLKQSPSCTGTEDVEQLKWKHSVEHFTLQFSKLQGLPQLGYWSLANSTSQSGIELEIASDKVSSSTDGSWSFIYVYVYLVYGIGRALRLACVLASQRMIYEEMPNTDLLLDLCNGIYTARINGDLNAEYKLYYELIHIYRSPELLFEISKGNQPNSYLGYWPHPDVVDTHPPQSPGLRRTGSQALSHALADAHPDAESMPLHPTNSTADRSVGQPRFDEEGMSESHLLLDRQGGRPS